MNILKDKIINGLENGEDVTELELEMKSHDQKVNNVGCFHCN